MRSQSIFQSIVSAAAIISLLALTACTDDKFDSLIARSRADGYNKIATPGTGLPFFTRNKLDVIWDATDSKSLAQVGDFKLVDHRGEQQDISLFHSKPSFVVFFYSTCHGICPTIISNLKRLEKSIPNSEDFNFLAVSVDPENDTTKTLANYSRKWIKATQKNWHFLTGDLKQVEALADKTFALEMGRRKGSGQLIHSERIFATDKNGFIRTVLNTTTEEKLIEKAQKVAQSLSQNRLASK